MINTKLSHKLIFIFPQFKVIIKQVFQWDIIIIEEWEEYKEIVQMLLYSIYLYWKNFLNHLILENMFMIQEKLLKLDMIVIFIKVMN